MDANFIVAILIKVINVSIHAPVMDAKSWHNHYKCHEYVSIHAPVMDAKNKFTANLSIT